MGSLRVPGTTDPRHNANDHLPGSSDHNNYFDGIPCPVGWHEALPGEFAKAKGPARPSQQIRRKPREPIESDSDRAEVPPNPFSLRPGQILHGGRAAIQRFSMASITFMQINAIPPKQLRSWRNSIVKNRGRYQFRGSRNPSKLLHYVAIQGVV